MSEPDPAKFQFGLKEMLLTVTVLAAFIGVLRAMYVKLGPESVIGVAMFCILLMTPTIGGASLGYWLSKGRRQAINQGAVTGLLVGVLLFAVLTCLLPRVQ